MRLRDGAEGCCTPKKDEQGPTVGAALAHFTTRPKGQQITITSRWFVDTFGAQTVRSLTTAHVAAMNAWAERFAPTTTYKRCQTLRFLLRHLAERHNAKRHLADDVVRPAKPKPRNVTATAAERHAIMAAAPPALRCWLLLCSDLAIRSGTAATLGPKHYDPSSRTLTFTTKYGSIVRLPVTEELGHLLDQCEDATLPFVSQLPSERRNAAASWPTPPAGKRCNPVVLRNLMRRMLKRIGITRQLTPHDLRRTTARQVYDQTRDLRLVQAVLGHSDLQSTLWYLQDSLTQVPVTALELAKLQTQTEVTQ